VSQGTLQAHFEYQSMICALTGMDVSIVSHYDGATASAEAVIMALQVTKGKRCKMVLSPTLHPQYRQVIHTYTQGMCLESRGEDAPLGDLTALASQVDSETACVVVQNPDFLGRLYRRLRCKHLPTSPMPRAPSLSCRSTRSAWGCSPRPANMVQIS